MAGRSESAVAAARRMRAVHFVVLQLIGLAIIVMFPALVLWVPSVMMR